MRLASLLATSLVFVGLLGCSRTGLEPGDPPPPPEPMCLQDSDCPVFDLCVPVACVDTVCQAEERIVCDDGDLCTADSCESATGECVFSELTFDQDGDGFKGPRPGFQVGTEGACGRDCNDASADAYPGGVEVCDGLDNDCNGVIDDGALFEPATLEPIRLSGDQDRLSRVGDLAFDGENYAATLATQRPRSENRFVRLAPDRTRDLDVSLNSVLAETFSGPLVYTGAFYGIAWSDRRVDNNYEVFFNRVDRSGKKLGPDIRVTDFPDFSRGVELAYDGRDFVLVWEDYVRFDTEGKISVYGQKISGDGELMGPSVRLNPEALSADFPAFAVGETRIGLVFTSTVGQEISGKFMSLQHELTLPAPIVDFGRPGVSSPRVYSVVGGFIAIWSEESTMVGDAIWGMIFDEQGNVLQAAQRLTEGDAFAHSPWLLPLGDRSLLFWAGDLDGNYEIHAKMVSNDLSELSPRRQLTFAGVGAVDPVARFGPDGRVGVAFNDLRTGVYQAYFIELECVTMP